MRAPIEIEFSHNVLMTPAWDRADPDPYKDLGYSGVDIHMILRGRRAIGAPVYRQPEGAVVFVLLTGWMLPHVRAIYEEQRLPKYPDPCPGYLAYHSLLPRQGNAEKNNPQCDYLDNQSAYCGSIGGAFAPDKAFEVLVAEGSEGVWKLLEQKYREIFLEEITAK